MPAIEAAAISASALLIGISCNSPPSRLMSRVPVSWSTIPALMKSAALKIAWLRMWNTATVAADARAEAQQHGHQAEMAHGRIGEDRLEVVLEQRDPGADQHRDEADAA